MDLLIECPTAVTVGNFDGVHMGHRQLINAVKQCSGYKSVVLSFAPHPLKLLNHSTGNQLRQIMTHSEKRALINELDIDYYIEYPFTIELANTPAEQFAHDVIFSGLNAKYIVTGADYRFGKDKLGDVNLLKKIGKEFGADVISVPPVMFNSSIVSSTYIRSLLTKGVNIETVNELLMRPYMIMGTVIKGKQLGKTIGFPTVNIVAEPDKLLPEDGVYMTKTLLDGNMRLSITNIGKNPTVGENVRRTIETHILDYNDDAYGKDITIFFQKYIRAEIKFASLDELKNQLAKDVQVCYYV